ncbi:MAG: molybdopterin-binding protein, partial [Anaerolineae bacterium]|nr:molybdopterin-binding protein [Anaerolineae bacterium]
MKAAILAIGDELTCGYQLDTNSQAISQQLVTIPVDVVLHLSVGDDPSAIRSALQYAVNSVDILVVTGGLGPTEDDLTRQLISSHFDLSLVENKVALQMIEERFAQRGRQMPESNRIQAQIPAGSQIIQNSRGTAAGFYIVLNGKHIFATPGVPFEMIGMLEGFIMPTLQGVVGQGRHVQRSVVKVYGIPESEINERIRPMLARERNPLLGLLPNRGTITIEVVAAADSCEHTQTLIEADLANLRTEFGCSIISEDGSDLPHVIGRLLTQRSLTISTGELGTGGLLAARLTEPRENQRWFAQGLVVTADTLDKSRSPQSPETAQHLAWLAREKTNSDIGVGIADLVANGSHTRNSYTRVNIAVDVSGKTEVRHFSFR